MNRRRSCAGIEKSKPKDIRSTFPRWPVHVEIYRHHVGRGKVENTLKLSLGFVVSHFTRLGHSGYQALLQASSQLPHKTKIYRSMVRLNVSAWYYAWVLRKKKTKKSFSTRMRVFFYETSMLYILCILLLYVSIC